MTDLDPRIRRALDNLPGASPEAHAEARRTALDALPEARRSRRPRWKLAVAAALGATVLTGTALAATGRIDVRLGKETPAPRVAVAEQPLGEVTLPTGAKGLAVVAGGQLWLKTASGLGVQGIAVSTAELSPNALYVAVGIGHSLVAMAPDGRRAWTHDTGGRVVAAAWAPNPIVVAYVVRKGSRNQLHVIEGNGDNDRLVDPDVSGARPSWRADTLALAYVGGDGFAHVVNYPSLTTVTVPETSPSALAFAPGGDLLAQEAGGPGMLVSATGRQGPSVVQLVNQPTRLVALTWMSADTLVVVGDEGPRTRLWALPAAPRLSLKASGSEFFAMIDTVSGTTTPGRLAIGVPVGAERQVWEVTAPEPGRDRRLAPQRVLVRLPASAGPIEVLSVR
jgi:hypothetical protein